MMVEDAELARALNTAANYIDSKVTLISGTGEDRKSASSGWFRREAAIIEAKIKAQKESDIKLAMIFHEMTRGIDLNEYPAHLIGQTIREAVRKHEKNR